MSVVMRARGATVSPPAGAGDHVVADGVVIETKPGYSSDASLEADSRVPAWIAWCFRRPWIPDWFLNASWRFTRR